jgi:hypothetical protein
MLPDGGPVVGACHGRLSRARISSSSEVAASKYVLAVKAPASKNALSMVDSSHCQAWRPVRMSRK